MKVTLIILTKILLITPPTHEFEKTVFKDSKFEFAREVTNWYRLGYELSVVT